MMKTRTSPAKERCMIFSSNIYWTVKRERCRETWTAWRLLRGWVSSEVSLIRSDSAFVLTPTRRFLDPEHQPILIPHFCLNTQHQRFSYQFERLKGQTNVFENPSHSSMLLYAVPPFWLMEPLVLRIYGRLFPFYPTQQPFLHSVSPLPFKNGICHTVRITVAVLPSFAGFSLKMCSTNVLKPISHF